MESNSQRCPLNHLEYFFEKGPDSKFAVASSDLTPVKRTNHLFRDRASRIPTGSVRKKALSLIHIQMIVCQLIWNSTAKHKASGGARALAPPA